MNTIHSDRLNLLPIFITNIFIFTMGMRLLSIRLSRHVFHANRGRRTIEISNGKMEISNRKSMHRLMTSVRNGTGGRVIDSHSIDETNDQKFDSRTEIERCCAQH